MRIWSGTGAGSLATATVLGRRSSAGRLGIAAPPAGGAGRTRRGGGAGGRRAAATARAGTGSGSYGGGGPASTAATHRDGDGHRRQHQAGDGPGRRQRPDAVPVREGPAGPVGLQRRLCRCLAGRQESGTPKAGSGVKASLLGTINRSDNTTQVTYNHHPLYYYSGDSQAGQENGQGLNAFGAAWFVVAPAGSKVG